MLLEELPGGVPCAHQERDRDGAGHAKRVDPSDKRIENAPKLY